MVRKLASMMLGAGGLLVAINPAFAAPPHDSESAFASDDAPHATVERLDQKDIRDDVYPVLLVRVDGQAVTNGSRKYVNVTPGKHVLRVKPDFHSIREYQPNSGHNQPSPNMNLQETNITVDMQAGHVYKIAVRRKGTSWTNFTPFVLKSWPADAEEPGSAD